MTRALWMTLTLGLALSGCGGEEQHERTPWDDIDQRVQAHYRHYGSHHVLLVGESLTALNPITSLCGLPVINAGYPGGKWDTVAARPVWSEIESDLIVVMLGTNNARRGPNVSHAEMIHFLQRLRGPVLWVVTTPPLFSWDALPPTLILPALQETELGLGYPVLDNRDVLNSPTFFTDGIHLNEAGYAKHNELLQTVCTKEEP